MPLTAPPEARNGQQDPAAPIASVPFTSAAREMSQIFHDETTAIGTTTTSVGPTPVLARGFIRSVLLLVEMTGAAAGAATVAADEDAPFNVFESIALEDVGGAEIVKLNGFGLYLANKYGAYRYLTDPKDLPSFVDVNSAGNFTFAIRVPVEISARDAFGALANQHGQQRYQLSYTVNASSEIYTTAPDTLGSVRVRAFLEAWTQPPATDLFGRPVKRQPDYHGTRQFWTRKIYDVESGDQTIQLSRVGNHVRTLVFAYRDDSSPRVRTTTELPDPISLYYDGAVIDTLARDLVRDRVADHYGLTGADEAAGGTDTGVIVWDFTHELDGKSGFETKAGYLPTTQATDLSLKGSFGGSGGKLEVITNDLVISGAPQAA